MEEAATDFPEAPDLETRPLRSEKRSSSFSDLVEEAAIEEKRLSAESQAADPLKKNCASSFRADS